MCSVAVARAAADRSRRLSTMRPMIASRISCPDAMLHLPTQKEGPSRGRRFDLRLSAGIRVARQARLETIMTPEDLDPPFARPIDALERLLQRLAMLYECGRHAVVVGKHRSEAQWQHRAVVGNAL